MKIHIGCVVALLDQRPKHVFRDLNFLLGFRVPLPFGPPGVTCGYEGFVFPGTLAPS